jgi:hypothetical protein
MPFAIRPRSLRSSVLQITFSTDLNAAFPAPQVIQRHAQSAFLLAFLNNFLETDSYNRAITTGAAEHLFW